VTTITASAPARVNIIGEHTDYNDGFVLPTCTALFTRVSAVARSDRELHVRSSTVNDTNSGEWVEYVKGVAAGLQVAGIELRGADLNIESNIPLGAGLSSSASLELSVGKALLGLAGATMAPPDLALLCQKAEQDFAGVRCGIMDQYTLACAQFGNALLLDCRSLQTKQVNLPDDMAFVLTDSGVRHSLIDGEYNNRAQECAAAVEIISKTKPSASTLRDVDAELLSTNKNKLGDVLFRRCRHVVTENERVMLMVQALETNELEHAGSLLSVLSACRKEDAAAAAAQICAAYAAVSGQEPLQHIVQAAHPVHLEESP
jgi:galactokinase